MFMRQSGILDEGVLTRVRLCATDILTVLPDGCKAHKVVLCAIEKSLLDLAIS